MVLGSSLYAFSAMLGAFLTGIAVGALVARRLIDRLTRPLLAYALGIAALGLLSLATTLVLPIVPKVFLRLVHWFGITGARTVFFQVGLAMLTMLPPTLVLGALFPLLARGLSAGGREAGSATGAVYFANTVGSASGAFAAGFLLIPALGLRGTLALAAALNFVTAGALAALLPEVPARSRLAGASLAAVAAATLAIVPLPWNLHDLTRGVFRHPLQRIEAGVHLGTIDGVPNDEIIYYRDGLNTTVSVHHDADVTYLKVNGKTDASSPGDMPTQVLSAHIPMLFGRPASRVLVIGLASGVTLGSVLRHPVERADAVEIEPAMVEASRFFDPWSGAPLDDTRARVILDDGRTYLSGTPERYDVIISEPSNPWISGVSNLFTHEFFSAAKSALEPGGRLLQWVQVYGLPADGLRSVLAAVRAEFPHVYVFSYQASFGDLLLLASLEPLRRDFLPRWEQLTPSVRDDLARVDILTIDQLWSLVRLLPGDIDMIRRDARVVNTDENLFVELSSPWLLHQESRTLRENWDMVRPFALGVFPLLRDLGEPMDPEAVGRLALAYADGRGDYEVGQTLGQSAARARSGHALAAAVALAKRSKSPRELLPSLDNALTLAPDAPDILVLRAQLRLAADRPEGALADADAARRVRPDDPRAQALRWQSLYRLGRLEEAEAELDAMAGSSWMAFQPLLWRDAADVWLARGRLDRGIAALQRRLDADRNWADGWTKLAEAYDRAGRPADAERARRNVATARRNRLLLVQREARMAAWRGDKQKAITLLERAAAEDPTYAPVREDLATLKR
jgi:spermidine synthase/tetratricopeptide (TPR) repeat protein